MPVFCHDPFLSFAAVAHSETNLIAENVFMDGGTDVLVRSPSRCVFRGVTGHSKTELQSVTDIHQGACLSVCLSVCPSRVINVKTLLTYKAD